MSDNSGKRADRRKFMKLIGAGAAAGSAALIAGKDQAMAAEQDPGTSDGLYRETEHVKRYYATTR